MEKAASVASAAAAPSEVSEDDKFAAEGPAPWISENTKKTKHPLVRLHNEILDFCNYVIPSRAEISHREKAIDTYLFELRTL